MAQTTAETKPIRKRAKPKGRAVEPQALVDVQALLGDAPRDADLLIEHLHRIQDHYGHLSAPHLVALAREMKMTPAEVYEVATFYHHFDVVKEGETAPPGLTVRVCDSVTCEMAGADELVASLEQGLGADVRVQRVPCVGRCYDAPVAVVGRNQVGQANLERVLERVNARATLPTRCATSPSRAMWPSTSTRASRAPSRTATSSSATRTASSRAR
jgi:formate dehydrogenase